MLTDGYLRIVQRLHLFTKHLLQFIVQALGESILLMLVTLEGIGYIRTQAEQAFGERLRLHRLATVRMLAEVLEVVTPVEYLEILLVLTHAINVFTQTGATPYHLHELDFRPYPLEENQVQYIRHIDARIHHVHRYSYLRQFVPHLEGINQGLCIVHLIVYQYTEVRTIFGIKLAETLHHQFRMSMLLGKDNGLADTLSALYPSASFH